MASKPPTSTSNAYNSLVFIILTVITDVLVSELDLPADFDIQDSATLHDFEATLSASISTLIRSKFTTNTFDIMQRQKTTIEEITKALTVEDIHKIATYVITAKVDCMVPDEAIQMIAKDARKAVIAALAAKGEVMQKDVERAAKAGMLQAIMDGLDKSEMVRISSP